MMRLPLGPSTLQYPIGAKLGYIPERAFSSIPLRVSSERLSMTFLAIRTFKPCINFSEDCELRETIAFSLTK
jgi:hypothetical protein